MEPTKRNKWLGLGSILFAKLCQQKTREAETWKSWVCECEYSTFEMPNTNQQSWNLSRIKCWHYVFVVNDSGRSNNNGVRGLWQWQTQRLARARLMVCGKQRPARIDGRAYCLTRTLTNAAQKVRAVWEDLAWQRQPAKGATPLSRLISSDFQSFVMVLRKLWSDYSAVHVYMCASAATQSFWIKAKYISSVIFEKKLLKNVAFLSPEYLNKIISPQFKSHAAAEAYYATHFSSSSSNNMARWSEKLHARRISRKEHQGTQASTVSTEK